MATDWIEAGRKARATDKMAETQCKALAMRVAKRWKFISFRGARKGEWRGAVDILAIRKDTTHPQHEILKRGDLFDIVLLQVKGGSAATPTDEDIRRMRVVAKRYRARSIVKFRWVNQRKSLFSVLNSKGEWVPSTAKEIFGE